MKAYSFFIPASPATPNAAPEQLQRITRLILAKSSVTITRTMLEEKALFIGTWHPTL